MGTTSRIPPLLIVFAALALRFFHLLSIENTALSSFLIGDEITHWKWANALLEGNIAECTPFFRAPLYGFFLMVPASLASDPLYAARFIQAVLGAGSAAAAMGIGYELCSPTVGRIAGILVATSPLLILFEGHLLIVTLYTFLGTAALFFLVRGVRRDSIAALACAGVLFGLCALSRPNVLLFIAPAFFWVYRKRGARPFLVVAVLIAACLVSAGWMNRYYGGERCLISTQGGINFYAGNGANADGLIPVEPENPLSPAETRARASRLPESVWSIDNLWTASLVIASAELGFPVRETEVSRWWFAKTLGQMARDPAAFLTRLVKKAAFLVGDVEVPNNLDPRFLMETFYPLLDFFDNWNRFSVLFALFVPGLCIAWNRYPETRVLSMYLSALALGLLAFFVNARFRVPLVPVLSLFAAVFLEALWKQFKRLAERPRRSAFLACAWLLAPAVLVSQCFRFYPETWQVRASRGLFLNAVSNAYLNRGQTGEAIETVDKALELDTAEAFLFYRTRARIELEREGGLERAIRYLERSLEMRRHPRTLRDLARLYGKAGRREDVLQMRETLSREYPETPS